jgi:tetratricopeptide (TPR) repeat protein
VVSKKYLDNGNKYFERGKYKEASLLYRRAHGKNAKYAEAWYRLGLTNAKLMAFSEARKDFARAMELDPADTDAMVRLGELDLLFCALNPRANQVLLADLKDLAQRLLKRDRRSFDGLRFSGEIALLEKDATTAIQKVSRSESG